MNEKSARTFNKDSNISISKSRTDSSTVLKKLSSMKVSKDVIIAKLTDDSDSPLSSQLLESSPNIFDWRR